MILVDTNVVADIVGRDPTWRMWSVDALDRSRRSGPVKFNDIVFAEMSARLSSEAEVSSVFSELGIEFERIPIGALFLSGQIYRQYRMAGGPRLNVLPDFFIGAHAQTTRQRVLTRDVRRYRTYFPDVELITP